MSAAQLTASPLGFVPNNWVTQLIPHKECRKCHESKPGDNFHRNARLAGGVEHHCKSCRAEEDRLRRLGQQQICTLTDKQCSKCGQTKRADCFQRNTGCCKECKRLMDSEARHKRKRKAATVDSGRGSDSPQREQQPAQCCVSVHAVCQHAAGLRFLNSQAGHADNKHCNGCHHEKNISDFLPDSRSADKTLSYCTACIRLQKAALLTGVETCRAASQHNSLAEDNGAHHVHAEANPPSAESLAEQVCAKCGEGRPAASFYWDTRYPTTMKPHCRCCYNASKRSYKQTHIPIVQEATATKICRKCQLDKPAAEFPCQRRSIDGMDGHCKACHRKAAAALVEARGPVPHPTVSHKKCTACGMQKPAEEFQHDRCKPDGLRGCCKPCETKKGRARSQARAPCMTPTVANKMCSRCREVKSADYFGRKIRRSDGLDCYCKECNSKLAAARNKKKRRLIEGPARSK